jgi:uncharacterized membrane protein YeaQ/YmgE (transglycosylase-associated protein family)
MMPLGLLSWILAGLVLALLSRGLLPGRPRFGFLPALLAGLGGAALGGLLATWLGFGGLASWDLRSFVVASLAAMLALVLARLATLAS